MPQYILFFLFIILSCQNNQDSPTEKLKEGLGEVANADSSKLDKKGVLMEVDLKKKVFDVGEPHHFTDTCAFDFGCDCCSGEIIFNEDQSFFQIEYCLPGNDVTFGTFQQVQDTVYLKHTGKWTGKYYNETFTRGSTEPEYFFKDTIIPAEILMYTISPCGNKLKLVRTDKKKLAFLHFQTTTIFYLA